LFCARLRQRNKDGIKMIRIMFLLLLTSAHFVVVHYKAKFVKLGKQVLESHSVNNERNSLQIMLPRAATGVEAASTGLAHTAET
jgi:hypothetical protein